MNEIKSLCFVEYARCLHGKGDAEKARRYFDKAVSLDAKNFVAYTSCAVFYLSQKEFGKARMYCDKAEAIKPEDVNTVLLFVIYESLGEINLAAESLKKIVNYTGNLSTAYEQIATLYSTFNMQERAEHYCKEALKISPNEGALHYNLGVVYYAQGRLHEAKNEFKSAIDLLNDKKYIKSARKSIMNINKEISRS